MMIKACITSLIITVFALSFALPLARMAIDNEEYKLKRWFQWTLFIFFVLFVLGAISTVALGILAIWV